MIGVNVMMETTNSEILSNGVLKIPWTDLGGDRPANSFLCISIDIEREFDDRQDDIIYCKDKRILRWKAMAGSNMYVHSIILPDAPDEALSAISTELARAYEFLADKWTALPAVWSRD